MTLSALNHIACQVGTYLNFCLDKPTTGDDAVAPIVRSEAELKEGSSEAFHWESVKRQLMWSIAHTHSEESLLETFCSTTRWGFNRNFLKPCRTFQKHIDYALAVAQYAASTFKGNGRMIFFGTSQLDFESICKFGRSQEIKEVVLIDHLCSPMLRVASALPPHLKVVLIQADLTGGLHHKTRAFIDQIARLNLSRRQFVEKYLELIDGFSPAPALVQAEFLDAQQQKAGHAILKDAGFVSSSWVGSQLLATIKDFVNAHLFPTYFGHATNEHTLFAARRNIMDAFIEQCGDLTLEGRVAAIEQEVIKKMHTIHFNQLSALCAPSGLIYYSDTIESMNLRPFTFPIPSSMLVDRGGLAELEKRHKVWASRTYFWLSDPQICGGYRIKSQLMQKNSA